MLQCLLQAPLLAAHHGSTLLFLLAAIRELTQLVALVVAGGGKGWRRARVKAVDVADVVVGVRVRGGWLLLHGQT